MLCNDLYSNYFLKRSNWEKEILVTQQKIKRSLQNFSAVYIWDVRKKLGTVYLCWMKLNMNQDNEIHYPKEKQCINSL